ncbi:hypothetical protein ACFLUD_01540 [Chloroflexota bacterium]
MKDYSIVEVNENTLEELIRHYAGKIEGGMKFIDHQVKTDREKRLDVLVVDSGGALAIVELKVWEDDGMLMQGIDYYDYASRHIDSISKTYEKFNIKPDQPPRLILIAPSFSIPLLNRCKWINIPISLYTYKCIKTDDDNDVMPVFTEINTPKIPKPPPARKSVSEVLEYITDDNIRKIAKDFLAEVKNWDKDNIVVDPIQDWISMKYKGRVFAYLGPRRRFFGFQTLDQDGNWPWLVVNQVGELDEIRNLFRTNIEKFKLGK